MALTFPLALNDFFQNLNVRQTTPDLSIGTLSSQTAGGAVIIDSVAERLWRFDVQLASVAKSEGQAMRAKLRLLQEPGASFLVYAKESPHPAADPGGALLAGFAPVLAGIASNNREISLAGLPGGYVISDGDFLGFQYGANPTRYAYHQVVVGAVASPGGAVTLSDVIPHIRPGAVLGAAVSLSKPVFKAVIVPKSVTPGASHSRHVDGVNFSLTQTLR